MRRFVLLLAIAAAAVSAAPAAQPSLENGTVLEAAERLKAGEFLWAPQVAPEGPVLVVINRQTQRLVAYRNGVPIGISTISTGRQGYRTPTGIFTILQKRVEHYSSIYDNAPMPYMQRLTWGGVALHAGNLPGYPASHGCIRLPLDFARLLYGVTGIGTTVVVTDRPTLPSVAPVPQLLVSRSGTANAPPLARASWNPERSPSGPLTIVVSATDRRVVVLRNGIVIGESPVTIDGTIGRTTAYVLAQAEGESRSWLRIELPGQAGDDATPSLRGRIAVPENFRRAVETVLAPGTTVVVTGDALQHAEAGRNVTLMEGEPDERPSAGTGPRQ